MLAEELIELQINSAAYTIFQAMVLLQFWTKQLVAYPKFAKAALHFIIPFPTTYLWESYLWESYYGNHIYGNVSYNNIFMGICIFCISSCHE